MRIVQTLWSAKEDLLRNSFGWLEPQYHLMSWALSCLSLKKNYDEVVLYTDLNGYKVLIEQLKLPYTDVIIQYENLICPKHQWAYAKMLSYSFQQEPFLHIDGDVYLPKKLDSKIEEGSIIVQNREIGTGYYKGMADRIQSEKVIFPDFLKKEIEKESISSYNAGVLGGNDLDFIQEYCQSVFDYIHSNQLFDSRRNYSCHNILFEQILFYALAVEKKKEVTTVLERDINDNGYSYHDFCDFYSFNSHTLMHIIGEHKRNKQICELLERTLLKQYPEYYLRIIGLFPEKHKRLQYKKGKVTSIYSYSEHLDQQRKRWEIISNDTLLGLEKESCNYLYFFDSARKNKKSFKLKKNPYLSIYEKKDANGHPQSDIALIPSLLNEGFHEVPIDDLSYNILILLDDERSLEYIKDKLQVCFKPNLTENKQMIEHQIKEKIEDLLYNKLIYINLN